MRFSFLKLFSENEKPPNPPEEDAPQKFTSDHTMKSNVSQQNQKGAQPSETIKSKTEASETSITSRPPQPQGPGASQDRSEADTSTAPSLAPANQPNTNLAPAVGGAVKDTT